MTESDTESYDSLEGFITEEEENKFIKYCEVCYKSCTKLVSDRFCSRCFNKDFIYGCVLCTNMMNIKTDKYITFIAADNEYHICWKCSEHGGCSLSDDHIRKCPDCNIYFFYDHKDFPKNQYNDAKLCPDCYQERREVDKENSLILKNVLIEDMLRIIRNYL